MSTRPGRLHTSLRKAFRPRLIGHLTLRTGGLFQMKRVWSNVKTPPGVPSGVGKIEEFRERRGLGAEAGAAAAGALGLRVHELEPRAVQALDVVDLGPLEVLVAHHVDVELHPVRHELLVHVGRLFLEVEVVLEAGAPASDDPDPKALLAEVLGGANLFDLGGGTGGERDHDQDYIAPGAGADQGACGPRNGRISCWISPIAWRWSPGRGAASGQRSPARSVRA